ncbi:hypothetical protein [Brevibacillus dissolubilis]|uniref:hypothetical protein n=1 Tax=Brevibacillus dissolubilis TaxID=1844116 RepID=UPI001116F738|nr:hypothetical protein [Brevibacillus dissolubilis]
MKYYSLVLMLVTTVLASCGQVPAETTSSKVNLHNNGSSYEFITENVLPPSIKEKYDNTEDIAFVQEDPNTFYILSKQPCGYSSVTIDSAGKWHIWESDQSAHHLIKITCNDCGLTEDDLSFYSSIQ